MTNPKLAFCDHCHWYGPEDYTGLNFNEDNELRQYCPICETDISFNQPFQITKRSPAACFIMHFLGGLLFLILYLVVQAFVLFRWTFTVGRTESPLKFHRDVTATLKKLPQTY